MPALEIDDGKSPESESEWTRNVISFIIRTPVRDILRHSLDNRRFHGLLIDIVLLSTNTAHVIIEPSIPLDRNDPGINENINS